jgi:hypothetical protein
VRPFNLGIVRVTRARSAGGKSLPAGLVWVFFRYGALVYDSNVGEWTQESEAGRPVGDPHLPPPPASGRR